MNSCTGEEIIIHCLYSSKILEEIVRRKLFWVEFAFYRKEVEATIIKELCTQLKYVKLRQTALSVIA